MRILGKLGLVGASDEPSFATLNALLNHNLIAPNNIVCLYFSESVPKKLTPARHKGIHVRRVKFDDHESCTRALEGVESLFLTSSPRVEMDFDEAAPGKGREADHFLILSAAKEAGVKQVFYASLAFASPSLSRVMKAHERTEEYLKSSGFRYTIIRQGLYGESWPLYLGHYNMTDDSRGEIVIAGDSPISWTSISDLGLANALIMTSPLKWAGRTLYLAQSQAYTLADVAAMVSKAKRAAIKVKIVSREEYENSYTRERNMDEKFVKWWSRTYDALRQGECQIQDPTLEQLLASKDVKPTNMEDIVSEMFRRELPVVNTW